MSKTVTIFGPSHKFTSGISYYTQRLGRALKFQSEKPIDVRYCLFDDLLPKFLFPGRKRIDSFSDSKTTLPYTSINWWNPVSLIESILAANRSDSIIFEWWTGAVGLQYIIAALLLRHKNTILEYHECIDTTEDGKWWAGLWSRTCLKVLVRLVHQGVFHSEWELQNCPREYTPGICHIVPHGVYDQYPRHPGAGPKVPAVTFNVLFFGLLRDYKGVRYLVDAFRRSDYPNWRLDIVGEEWDATGIPVDPRIHRFNGYINDEGVVNYFSNASVVVLPYTRASQSGVSFIAMNYGLPIVASDVGGLSESLQHYDGAWLVEPENPEQILEALEQVYQYYDEVYPADVPEPFKWKNITKMWREIL